MNTHLKLLLGTEDWGWDQADKDVVTRRGASMRGKESRITLVLPLILMSISWVQGEKGQRKGRE